METSDTITLAIGIYASIVSTIAIVWNILRERRNVSVNAKLAFGMRGFQPDEKMVAVEVINNGNRPINIQELGCCLSGTTKVVDITTQYDFGWLRDGDGKSFFMPESQVFEMKKVAKKQKSRVEWVYIRDSTNHYYLGEIIKGTPIDKWFNE